MVVIKMDAPPIDRPAEEDKIESLTRTHATYGSFVSSLVGLERH